MSEVAIAAGEANKAATYRFVIDTRTSRFTVRAFATGMLSAMGHSPTIGIRDFSGEMTFDPEQIKASDFQLSIKSSSLSVQDDISDKDRREMERLMNEQVLEVSQFPLIRYEAPGISVTKMGDTLFSAKLDGRLTFHGVSRNESVTARVALTGLMFRASGEFSLSQSNYGIKPVSVAGGALKLKDELKFSFEIVARRPE
jgi:polyisoprenoid-binding protein YceI